MSKFLIVTPWPETDLVKQFNINSEEVEKQMEEFKRKITLERNKSKLAAQRPKLEKELKKVNSKLENKKAPQHILDKLEADKLKILSKLNDIGETE